VSSPRIRDGNHWSREAWSDRRRQNNVVPTTRSISWKHTREL